MKAPWLLLACIAAAFSCAPGPVDAAPPSEKYRLIWADEFDGTTLDTTRWNYRQLGPRRDAVNVKDTVRLDGNGSLVLTTRRVGEKFHTAMIGTQGKFEAKFGYAECRVRLQKQLGHWSAFWLQSPTMKDGGAPREVGTEIDIFEYLRKNKDTILFNLHWNGYGKNTKHVGSKLTLPGLGEGFHTVGIEWTPTEYIFFVDGKPAWRTDQAVSHVKQYIILSLEVGKWAGDIHQATLPDDVRFDYCRFYQTPATPGGE